MRSLLVTGDSHLGSLMRGLHESTDPALTARRIEFWPLGSARMTQGDFFQVDPHDCSVSTVAGAFGDRRFSPESVELDGELPLLAVSLPLHSARVVRNAIWKTHVPWSLIEGEHETPLSDQAVDALIEADSCRAVDFVVQLKKAGLSVVVLEAPRFFENATFLSNKRLDIHTHLEARYRQCVIARLEKAGLAVIRQPSETITERGTTDPAFDHDDPEDQHHANARYGELMLAALAAYADGGEDPAAQSSSAA